MMLKHFWTCLQFLLCHFWMGSPLKGALHSMWWPNMVSDGFMRSADIIHSKANHLLFSQNKNGDTPLHCVARAGMSRMVCHLISLARDENTGVNRVKELLEIENNLKDTSLHQAVRVGNNDMVKLLMEENSELASFPKDGTSPLYLAILLEEYIIVETLYNASHMKLSYSGPNGQNALHAAVLRGTELTKKLLEWDNGLTTQGDESGSTPLHFAAALVQQSQRGSVCWQLLEANSASINRTATDYFQYMLLPLSVKEGQSLCFLTSLQAVQDNDGNTALHLAIQTGSVLMFSALLGNRQIHLNLSNKNGQTPLDISRYKIPRGLFDDQNSEMKIHFALTVVNARSGGCRRDHFEENYNHQFKHNEREELEKVKELTQTLCIAAVLIATLAFGATFAIPGGYRADEHTNGGTPTLARRYTFDAFIIASTFSFLLSAMSIVGLMYSGYSMLNPHSRRIYLLVAMHFGSTSLTCFATAFALGLYMVLAPVAHKSAIAICVISPLVVLCNKMEFWLKWALLARPLCTRIGLVGTLVILTMRILFNMLMEFWPIIFIFVWATYTRNHP